MFTSLRGHKPDSKKKMNKEYEQPASTETDSLSNAPRRKRGMSLSKQHSIAFDRIYSPKDLNKQPKQRNVEENGESLVSWESKNSGMSQSKKISLKSVKSEKYLLTNDSISSSRMKITIGLGSKSKSKKKEKEDSPERVNCAQYGKINSKNCKSPKLRAEYGFVRNK